MKSGAASWISDSKLLWRLLLNVIRTEQLTLTSLSSEELGDHELGCSLLVGKSGRTAVTLETCLQCRTEAPQGCLWQKSPGT